MSFRRYYEDELAYLRELGEAFGRANPAVAGLLSRQGTDPDVERLLEGFAFLTGRLRERLDQQLPELSHGLLTLLWPYYLRPIPALTTVEFLPGTPLIVGVPAGSAVASRPVEGTVCRFRTCWDLPVLPATIVQASYESGVASASLSLTIRPVHGAPLATLAEQRLRVFLHGDRDPRLGPRLLRALLDDVSGIELASGSARRTVAPDTLRHAGFLNQEAALPWPHNGFPGFRILQEFLAFPEKFMFVDLPPLPESLLVGDSLTVTFRFDHIPDLPGRIGAENFRVNCVPVINLYPATADPLPLNQHLREYRLVPAAPASRHARVHTIDRMEAMVQGRADAVTVPAFESFTHLRPGQPGLFYRARMRPAVLFRGGEMWVSFVDGSDQPILPAVDTIIARLTCTDGEVAELVPVGGVSQVAAGSPAAMTFRNITPVTPEAPPPLQGDTLWRLVAGLARSLAPLADIESLRALIASYDFHAIHDEQRRRRLDLLLSGLVSLDAELMERLVNGIPVPGRQVTLTVKESGFGGAEGAFLFGAALDAFIGIFGGLN
ncbi:MAG: type VI secretion system baseplate subunit TssF, partial [Acetobacteraceae bacterium]